MVDFGRSQRWQPHSIILGDSVAGLPFHILQNTNTMHSAWWQFSIGRMRSCRQRWHWIILGDSEGGSPFRIMQNAIIPNYRHQLFHARVTVCGRSWDALSCSQQQLCMHAACMVAAIRVVGIVRNMKWWNGNMKNVLWKEQAKLWAFRKNFTQYQHSRI